MAIKKIIGAAKSILRDDYKPKLKNEKEIYSKQDYSDVIKNYEKTQQKKKEIERVQLLVELPQQLQFNPKRIKKTKNNFLCQRRLRISLTKRSWRRLPISQII